MNKKSRSFTMVESLFTYYAKEGIGISQENDVRIESNDDYSITIDKNDHVIVIEVLDVIHTMEKANKPSNEISAFIEETIPREEGNQVTPIDPTWPVLTYLEERVKDECGCPGCRPEFHPGKSKKGSLMDMIEGIIGKPSKITENEQGDLIEFHLNCSTSFLEHTKGNISFEQLLRNLSYNSIKTADHLQLDMMAKLINRIKPELFLSTCNPAYTLATLEVLCSISRNNIKELLSSHPNYMMANKLIEDNTKEILTLLGHDYNTIKNALDLAKDLFRE